MQNKYINHRITVLDVHATFIFFHRAGIPLEITTHPEDQIAVNGVTVIFTCSATGDSPISYQWFYNNNPIPSANITTYIFTASYDSFGSYHCNATSGSVEVVSNSATLSGMDVFKCLYFIVILLFVLMSDEFE